MRRVLIVAAIAGLAMGVAPAAEAKGGGGGGHGGGGSIVVKNPGKVVVRGGGWGGWGGWGWPSYWGGGYGYGYPYGTTYGYGYPLYSNPWIQGYNPGIWG